MGSRGAGDRSSGDGLRKRLAVTTSSRQATGSAGTPKAGGDLTVADPQPPTSLDPILGPAAPIRWRCIRSTTV